MTVFQDLDRDLLQKLLLGELPSAEVERLAAQYADDDRLAELGESLVAHDETLVDLLHNRETVVDVDGERLVERLLVRLRSDHSGSPKDNSTEAFNDAGVTERNPLHVPVSLPGCLEFYRPVKVLGQGGMGTVYLAEDTRLGRNVAIKTLRPELAVNAQAKERFLREARLAAMLEHDHIVPIYSVGEADGTPFLAMPLLKGEPLNALIQRTNGPLPVPTAVRLAREVALGLAAAHERGLIHRDIKPGNIWLEAPTGRVKILDFGLAKAAEVASEGMSELNLTATGAIVGTPAYMAPEQANGDPVDCRADLFSLGCILYEMLSGQRAFSGATTFSILMSLASQIPIAPDKLSPQCPPALSRLVMQLLEKDPAKRPVSATAVIQALDHLDSASAVALTDPLPVILPQPEPQAVGWAARASLLAQTRPSRLRSDVAVIAAACLLACIGVAIVFGGQIVRVITNTGELMVEIDDPTVEVRIIQNGLIVRDTTNAREFELTAVDGKVEVLEKNGIKLATKKFQLTRGGTARVSVSAPELAAARQASSKTQVAAHEVEPAPITPPSAQPLADKANPFVLVQSSGQSREEFGSFDGVLGALSDGDVIEVHGNGPFTLGAIILRGKGLRLRAAAGYRPQFVMSNNVSSYHWIEVENGVLDVDGCDFRCGIGLAYQCFRGNGPVWEFRNCRFLGADVGLFNYDGPKFRIVDCLISGFTPPGYEGFGPGSATSKLEMINTIVRTHGYHLLQVPSDGNSKGDWTIHLQHNTLYVNGGLTLHLGRKQFGKARIAASENLFNVTGVANNLFLKEIGGWQGHDNLYVGRQAIFTFLKGAKDPVVGLKAWADFWGADEQGGREAEWTHYAWDEVRRQGHDPQRVIQVLSPITAALASQHGAAMKDLGPDWALVGPGDAYVRALEAAGKKIARDQLRPEPLADGPFVLIHEDQIVRGFTNIGDAVAAAASGDVVEIRTDEPFGRCPLKGDKPRQLTVRAAPGYRPVSDDGFDFASKNLSLAIEGLHFSKFPLGAGLGGDSTEGTVQNSIARVANCSFASRSDFAQFAGRLPRNGINGPRFEAADGKPGEIVNCLIPGMVSTTLPAGGKLLLRNSVVGNIQIYASSSGQRALELDRCVLWNPCGDLSAIRLNATDPQKTKADVVVTARHTLFEAGSRFIQTQEGIRVGGWTGAGNLYRVGHRPWITVLGRPVNIGLTDWKLRWKSDADSVEADPVDYDPQQWRLLPSSPGYQAGPNGQDLGADVNRIGTIQHQN
ncbi:MAG: hypothetical protein JWN70_230 [Planctomycetaceae bacterium]|nr:hypothetical protein [Planctomycetaceae bacterium]